MLEVTFILDFKFSLGEIINSVTDITLQWEGFHISTKQNLSKKEKEKEKLEFKFDCSVG